MELNIIEEILNINRIVDAHTSIYIDVKVRNYVSYVY